MASVEILPVPPRVKDHSGRRFGRLVVLGFVGMDPGARPRPRFICQCDCGKEHTARSAHLLGGWVKSCGCLASENGRSRGLASKGAKYPGAGARHGMSHKPEHNAWAGMKQRCHNPRNKGFKNYGARGIFVCERWRDSFEAFLADMGRRPTDEHSLERIDNDGPYAPGNVRWATSVEQANNKRDTHLVDFGGRKVSLADAERLSGISQKVLYHRAKAGRTGDALFAPIDQRKSGSARA